MQTGETGSTGIRDRDLKKQLRLGSEMTSSRVQECSRAGYREAKGRTFSQDSEKECQDIVEGPAFSETQKILHRVRAGAEGTRATR